MKKHDEEKKKKKGFYLIFRYLFYVYLVFKLESRCYFYGYLIFSGVHLDR